MIEHSKKSMKTLKTLGIIGIILTFLDFSLTLIGINRGFEEGNKVIVFLAGIMGYPIALSFSLMLVILAFYILYRVSKKSKAWLNISTITFASRNIVSLFIVIDWASMILIR